MQIVISAPLPTHFHEGCSQLQEISSQKQGMERDGLLEWWDQDRGGFTPITSQHSDLSLTHPDLDVGMSPDGIKPPQSPYHLVAGTAPEDG